MRLDNYRDYVNMRDEVISRGMHRRITTEAAGNGVATLDIDNIDYFAEYVGNCKDNLLEMHRAGFLSDDALTESVDLIDEYAMPLLDHNSFAEREALELKNKVNLTIDALYERCQAGDITTDQREEMINRIKELGESCGSVEELNERLGVYSEGILTDVRTKIGGAIPGRMTVKFGGKVMNLKAITRGVELKAFKQKYNGIELQTNPSITKKLCRGLIDIANKRADAIAGKRAEKSFRKIASAPPAVLLKSLKVKYLIIEKNMITAVCKHALVPGKDEGIEITYNLTGKSNGIKFKSPMSKPVKESLDMITNDILDEALMEIANSY